MSGGVIVGAIVNLNHPDPYIHWEFIFVSLANFVVIAVLVVLFVLAIGIPFMNGKSIERKNYQSAAQDADGGTPEGWTGRSRHVWLKYLPPDKLLPDGQPSYVASWVYVFGVLTIGALALAILSGMVLAIEGPTWWHVSPIGLFVNSLHLWSVELFMGFMTVHLWAKFWMAAWRGKRQLTWMTGVLAFLVSIFEAFTGYLSQTNFDSQWIAFESKDAFNGGGIGAVFNAMNFGQALMFHIVLVPIILVVIVGIHVLMVRIRGVVPPIGAEPAHLGEGEDAVVATGSTAETDHAVTSVVQGSTTEVGQ
jgi:ubiquinol-cytochrome c reductase cytochrome b subunit